MHMYFKDIARGLVALGLLLAGRTLWGQDNLVHHQFQEVDTLFANPGQGWMRQQRSPRGEPRFPCSVVYIRFNWADIEPEEGRYQWGLIDDVINAWKPRGAKVAMRVMTCNAHSAGYYTSPQWLFDAGCKGFDYLRGGDDPTSGGKRIPRLEPDYADPIYLARHGAFLAALGRRYDGHPDVEFLDIGSYGIWGEWHTSHPALVEVRKQIVDLYLKAFKRTPLVFMSDDAEVLNYALARGTGFRRDGVGSPWHEQNWIGSKKYAGVQGMGETWKKAPVVFEWFGNYDYLQSRSWSFDDAVNFMLKNHVTLINDNIGRVPPSAMPTLQKLARLSGYRFALRELVHEKTLASGEVLNVHMKWANLGVGKLYYPFELRVILLDGQGHAALTAKAKADPRDWLPGEWDLSEPISLPAALPAGDYTLAMTLVDASQPARFLRLAMEAPEKEGQYAVSRLNLTAAATEPAKKPMAPEPQEFVFKTTPQGDLKLVVHYPVDWKPSDQRPAIIFFFGGGWRSGSINQFLPQASYFASRGMVAVRADYRVFDRQKVTPDQCVEDARSALRWVRRQARELGVDPRRVAGSGGSAGGHLAACAALCPGPDAPGDDLTISCQPNVLVLFNPVLDLGKLGGLKVAGVNGQNLAEALSPIRFAGPQAPPTVMFYGDQDRFLEHGRDFQAKTKGLKVPVQVFTAANQAHGFFNRSPWTEITLRQADEFLASLGYLTGQPTLPPNSEKKLQP